MSLKLPKVLPKVVHYNSLKDSDISCADPICGMLAQAMFKGITQDWYVCNRHAAEVLSYWDTINLVDDSLEGKHK